ncbi:MAG: reverse transcriptase domain-containing protein [Elusimicrobiota bacterium]
MKVFNFSEKDLTPERFIKDRHTLSAVTMSKPSKISAAHRFKEDLQKRHGGIKKRKIFVSKGNLKYSQDKIKPLLETMFHSKCNTDHILSYIKGKNPHTIIREECVGKDMLIKFDIRKYYDNISGKMIYNSLKKLGFNHQGATHITKLCTVKIGNKYSLQQGSSVSPVLSNIVGYFYIDKPVQSYLEEIEKQYPKLEITYKRFCDNIGIWVDGPVPTGFSDQLKEEIKRRIKTFKVHDWYTIRGNHPKLAQTFLGVTLNSQMKIQRVRYDKIRAILFNSIIDWTLQNALKYFRENGDDRFDGVYSGSDTIEKFHERMGGYVNYVKQVNQKQGLRLEKLLEASKKCTWMPLSNVDILEKIKKYTNDDESVQEYMSKIFT